MMSKAYVPGEALKASSANLTMKHWGMEEVDTDVTADHVAAHPFGEAIAIDVEPVAGAVSLQGSGQSQVLAGPAQMNPFDGLVVPGEGGPFRIRIEAAGHAWDVVLPAGCTLGWMDIAWLVWDQHRETMQEDVDDVFESGASEPFHLPALVEKVEATQDPAERAILDASLFWTWVF